MKGKVATWPCDPFKKNFPIRKNPYKSHIVCSLICNITVQNMRWPCGTTLFAVKPNISYFAVKYTRETIIFGPTTDSVPAKSLKITDCVHLHTHYHCTKYRMAFAGVRFLQSSRIFRILQ